MNFKYLFNFFIALSCWNVNEKEEIQSPSTKQIMQKRMFFMVSCPNVDDNVLERVNDRDLEEAPVRLCFQSAM